MGVIFSGRQGLQSSAGSYFLNHACQLAQLIASDVAHVLGQCSFQYIEAALVCFHHRVQYAFNNGVRDVLNPNGVRDVLNPLIRLSLSLLIGLERKFAAYFFPGFRRQFFERVRFFKFEKTSLNFSAKVSRLVGQLFQRCGLVCGRFAF